MPSVAAPSGVFIHGVGMACPVGLQWAAACAAMRAGITRRSELPYLDDRRRPIAGSYLAELDRDWTVEQRWLYFLGRAVQEAARAPGCGPPGQVPLVLALPPDVRGRPIAVEWLARQLATHAGAAIHPGRIRVITAGAYGGLEAIAAAREMLHGQRESACLVAAADSMIGARSILDLARHRRLLTEDNADGVTPGEAAVCFALSGLRDGALAAVRGVGRGMERGLLGNDVPLRAEGITVAARGALAEARLAFEEIDFRLSDAAGESYHFKEQALCVGRLLRRAKEKFPLWLTAESLGDTGAAAGLCGMAWAVAAFARRYAPGPRAISFAGNEQGQRAALVLESMEAA